MSSTAVDNTLSDASYTLTIHSDAEEVMKACLVHAAKLVAKVPMMPDGLPYSITDLIGFGFSGVADQESAEDFINEVYAKTNNISGAPQSSAALLIYKGFQELVRVSAYRAASLAGRGLDIGYLARLQGQLNDPLEASKMYATGLNQAFPALTQSGDHNVLALFYMSAFAHHGVPIDVDYVWDAVRFLSSAARIFFGSRGVSVHKNLSIESQVAKTVAHMLRDDLQVNRLMYKKLPPTPKWWMNKRLSL